MASVVVVVRMMSVVVVVAVMKEMTEVEVYLEMETEKSGVVSQGDCRSERSGKNAGKEGEEGESRWKGGGRA
eukprot:748160-Hanusia_phi.AAC.2